MSESFEAEMMALFDAFVDNSLSGVTGSEMMVWFALFRGTDHTRTARMGTADIARRSRLSARTVRRTVATLQAKGLLRVARRGRSGPHVYRVCTGVA